MTGSKWVVLVLVLTFLSPARGDAKVSCDFMESCVLPCSFQSGDEVVLHWYQMSTKDTPAHSYYYNQDQLGLQNQRFRGRTSLFKDQISRGNASLRLTRVEVQDQGRYKCYTSTITGNRETFINLNVDARVNKVDIEQVENRITCSSEGIYPQPELTWSTSPPSNMSSENKPTVQQTDQLLYNINSSLIVSGTDLVYSCTVRTRSNKRTATLFKQTSISGLDTDTTIPCESLNPPLTGLVWRFNHSQIILNQTGDHVPYTVSKEWRQRVKSVSESGNLTLKDLSSDQDGMYTCELSNAEETYVTNTLLRIEKTPGKAERGGDSGNVGPIIGGVVAGILVVVALAGVLVWYCKKKTVSGQENPTQNGIELTDTDEKTTPLLPGQQQQQQQEDPKQEEEPEQQQQQQETEQAAETDGAQDN